MGFPGTRGNEAGDIMVVAESYGAEEEKQGKPLVGASGQELDKIFEEVGVDPKRVFYTNIVNARPPSNDMRQFFYPTAYAKDRKLLPTRGLYPQPIVMTGLRELQDQIAHIKPKVIIGFGNYTLWGLTDTSFRVANDEGYKIPTGIGSWRGSQLRDSTFGIPFLPAYHPAAALRNWPWRYLIKHDIARRMPKAFNNTWEDEERRFIVRPSLQTVLQVLNELIAILDEQPVRLAVDIETRSSFIACIGLAWSVKDAICIPFMQSGQQAGYWTYEEEWAIVRLLRHLLAHPNLVLCGQNFLYDAQYIARYWHVIPRIYYDTRIMQHLIYPGTPQDLGYISSLYCNYHSYWKDEGKTWEPWMDEAQLWAYNCRDCVVTFEATEELLKLIKYHEQEEQYKWQQRQLQSILRMMLRGVAVHKEAKTQLILDLMEVEAEYARSFQTMLPEDVYPTKPKAAPWYRSDTQQVQIFYAALGCKAKRNRKTGSITVDDAALEQLMGENPILTPLIQKLQQYRSLSVFTSFANMTTGVDGRMRCTFSPTTETFRWASSEDAFGSGRNLQNIPKGTEKD